LIRERTLNVESLKDLPLAMAFGLVCIWFMNQNNLEFGKKYIALINEFNEKYEAVIATVLEERKQWFSDSRADKVLLYERLDKNTEAMIVNANETHQLRTALTPLKLKQDQEDRPDSRPPRKRGPAESDTRDRG
jgi:hypothetical protein